MKNKSPFTIIEADNHRYIYYRGKLLYKRWQSKRGTKTQPSRLFNRNGWPPVEVV